MTFGIGCPIFQIPDEFDDFDMTDPE